MVIKVVKWLEPVMMLDLAPSTQSNDQTYLADLLNNTHLWNHQGAALVVW